MGVADDGYEDGEEPVHDLWPKLSDEQWGSLVEAVHLPGEARLELDAVIQEARTERYFEITLPRPAETNRMLLEIKDAAIVLRAKIDAALNDDFVGAILACLEEEYPKYRGDGEPDFNLETLLSELKLIDASMDVAVGATPRKPGPKDAGLRTLVVGATEVVRKHTGKMISRSANRTSTGKFTYTDFFKRLYSIADLPGGSGRTGANVVSQMAALITEHRARDKQYEDGRLGKKGRSECPGVGEVERSASIKPTCDEGN